MPTLVRVHEVDERQQSGIRHGFAAEQPAVHLGDGHAQELGDHGVRVSLDGDLEKLDADVGEHAATLVAAAQRPVGQPRQSLGRLRQSVGRDAISRKAWPRVAAPVRNDSGEATTAAAA